MNSFKKRHTLIDRQKSDVLPQQLALRSKTTEQHSTAEDFEISA